MPDRQPTRAQDKNFLRGGKVVPWRDEISVDCLGDGLGGPLYPSSPDEDEEGVEETLEVLGSGGVLGMELHREHGIRVRDYALVGPVVGVGE